MVCVLVVAVPCLALHAQTPRTANSTADYVQAEALIRNRQWDDGLQILNHVLAAEPRNLKAMNLAGIAYAAKGDTQTANRFFQDTLAVDPHFLPALRNLSISEFNAQDYPSAEKHLMDAREQQPNDPAVNLYLGRIAYRQQKYALAVERLEFASSLLERFPLATAELAIGLLRTDQGPRALDLVAQLNPSAINAQMQLELGFALSETGNDALAIPYLQAAFEHNPDAYDVGFDLALAYVRVKDNASAISTIQNMIGRSRNTSELENLLAEALAAQGETGKAIDAFRTAIALDPADENNYLDFASLCMDHKAFEDGLKVVALGLRLHPDSERLTFMRGLLEASEDKVDLAEKDFQEAARLAPQRNLGALGLGAVYLQQGNSEDAIKVARRQLTQRPEDPSLLYLLGEALIASGAQPGQPAYGEAQRALEQAVKLSPGLCLPHISLGSIYLREDRFADAAAQFESARAIDPGENSAYSHLASAYRHLGQPEKAREVLVALQNMLEQQRSGTRVKAATPSVAVPQ